MNTERLYIVTYDIADQRRWRRVFKIMQGYGDWLLLSVVQWHLTARHRAGLETARITFCWSMLALPNTAEQVKPAVTSIGRCFARIERRATVIYGDMMTRITKMLSMVPPTLVERSGAVVIPVSA
ncbi:MAG: CRISPR-associated endonuclease Cas2 [Rhodobacteraceae bacterium]|nr:CRISPR-associated endonuclease Cas2 [Paracoccaceae bacterium]